jgi:hypothetical protein
VEHIKDVRRAEFDAFLAAVAAIRINVDQVNFKNISFGHTLFFQTHSAGETPKFESRSTKSTRLSSTQAETNPNFQNPNDQNKSVLNFGNTLGV